MNDASFFAIVNWGSAMARDLSQEPLLPVNDIQGDILLGLPKRVERLLFFKIEHVQTFRNFLAQLNLLGAAPTSKDASQKPHRTFHEFALMQGGEYFFAPAISAVKGFSALT
jgi:hypothetical protein